MTNESLNAELGIYPETKEEDMSLIYRTTIGNTHYTFRKSLPMIIFSIAVIVLLIHSGRLLQEA